MRDAVTAVYRVVSPRVDLFLASLSTLISLGAVAVFVSVARRFRAASRAWPVTTIHGVEVRVSARLGPVVIGIARPEIIVPRWLLSRGAEEQRLAVIHEQEHVRARDPLLLALAGSAVVLMPWNPALWYMFSRLRLAVELDCDARVLRRGAEARSYGALLIDVAQRASPLRSSALAFTAGAAHLRQRLLAMAPNAPRLARARATLASMVAGTAIVVACRTSLPAPVLDASVVSLEGGASMAANGPGGAQTGDLPFTDEARHLLTQASREADELQHEYIGTEHLLLALTQEPASSAVLAPLGLDGARVRSTITEALQRGRAVPASRLERPYTSRTRKALALASAHARTLGRIDVGIEHVIVGLMQERKGIAAQVLQHSGLTVERALEYAAARS